MALKPRKPCKGTPDGGTTPPPPPPPPPPPVVASVIVSLSTNSIVAGQTAQATAVVKDFDGNILTDHVPVFSSLVPGIVSVNQSGVVTGVSAGAGSIRATVDTKAGDANITVTAVTPPPPDNTVHSIELSPLTVDVLRGQSITLSYVAKNQAGGIISSPTPIVGLTDDSTRATWGAITSSQAVVNGLGTVSGSTQVRLGSGAIRSNNVTVNVVVPVVDPPPPPPPPPPVATVTVLLQSSNINPGQTTQATAVARDSAGNVLTGRVTSWSTTANTIATVGSTGLVAAVIPGTVSIIATVEGIQGGAVLTVASIIVTPPPVATVVTTLGADSIQVGQTTQASATPKDAGGNALSGRVITWSSVSPSVATVSPSGLVTGISAGTAVIRATVEGINGDATITVVAVIVDPPPPPPVATVTVALSATTVNPGQTSQAVATAKDAGGNVLIGRSTVWSVSPPSLASVSQSGLVTAINNGTATIIATVEGLPGAAALTIIPSIVITTPDRPNEPPGMLQLSPTLTGDVVPPSFWTSLGWVSPGGITQAVDVVPGIGSTNVLHINFPAGSGNGSAPGVTYAQYSAIAQDWPSFIKTLYIAYWYKVSPGFPISLNANKMMYVQVNHQDNGILMLQSTADEGTNYTAPIHPQIVVQNVLSSNGDPRISVPYPNYGINIQRGVWNLFEGLFVANTAGNADGSAKMFLGGSLVVSVPNIAWNLSGATAQWNSMLWDPVYNNAVPADAVGAYHRLKNLYVSGRSS